MIKIGPLWTRGTLSPARARSDSPHTLDRPKTIPPPCCFFTTSSARCTRPSVASSPAAAPDLRAVRPGPLLLHRRARVRLSPLLRCFFTTRLPTAPLVYAPSALGRCRPRPLLLLFFRLTGTTPLPPHGGLVRRSRAPLRCLLKCC
jgi:hypothetical protein